MRWTATAYGDANVQRLGSLVEQAQAVMIASPVYNYDVNSAAKNAVELTGRAWTGKVVAMMLAAGGQGSYMSAMGLANSLMLDFRCVIVPRFVYATGESFEGDHLADDNIQGRVEQLVDDTLRLARAKSIGLPARGLPARGHPARGLPAREADNTYGAASTGHGIATLVGRFGSIDLLCLESSPRPAVEFGNRMLRCSAIRRTQFTAGDLNQRHRNDVFATLRDPFGIANQTLQNGESRSEPRRRVERPQEWRRRAVLWADASALERQRASRCPESTGSRTAGNSCLQFRNGVDGVADIAPTNLTIIDDMPRGSGQCQ